MPREKPRSERAEKPSQQKSCCQLFLPEMHDLPSPKPTGMNEIPREVGPPMTMRTTLPVPILLQRAHVVFAEHKGDLSLHLLSFFNRVNDEKVPCKGRRQKHSGSCLWWGKPRPQETVQSPKRLPLSPLLIQMFFRYLEGMLTRKRCPWAVSTSCRLFPGVLRTWSRRDQEPISFISLFQHLLSCTAPCPNPRGLRGMEEWGRQSRRSLMPLTLTICCWSEGTMCSPSTSFTTCFLLVA